MLRDKIILVLSSFVLLFSNIQMIGLGHLLPLNSGAQVEESSLPNETMMPKPTMEPTLAPTVPPDLKPEETMLPSPTLAPTLVPIVSPSPEVTSTGTPEKEEKKLLVMKIQRNEEMQKILDNYDVMLVGDDETQNSVNDTVQTKLKAVHTNANKQLKAFIKKDVRTNALFAGQDLGLSEVKLNTTFANLLQMAQGYRTYQTGPINCGTTAITGTINCYQDSQIVDAIVEGMNWIYDNYYQDVENGYYGNWYAWEIGHPMSITKILSLMEKPINDKDPDLIRKFVAVMDQYLRNGNGDIDLNSRFHTGSNLADIAVNRMVQGALINDELRISQAVEKIMTVFKTIDPANIEYGNTDGYYADGSFIQHHRVAYTGTYGVNLLDKVMTTVKLLNNSNWDPGDSLFPTIQNWLYQGFSPVVMEGYMMEIVKGRSIAKNSTGYSNNARFIEALVSLADMLPEAEQNKMYAHMKYIVQSCPSTGAFNSSTLADLNAITLFEKIMNDADIASTNALNSENHYAFNSMDKNIHIRSGYTLALSRSSNRISKYEYMSGQNRKPWFQGDGAFYLYFEGADHNEEYGYQYIATVDPYRYPGTTVPVEQRKTIKELYGNDWYENADHELNFTSSSVSQNDYVYFPTGTNTYSGSATWDKYAVAGMQLGDENAYAAKKAGILPKDFVVYKNTDANKSWFMFDKEIVFLGSNIHDEMGRQVLTTIDNRMTSNDAVINAKKQDDSEIIANNGVLDHPAWIHLEAAGNKTKMGYYFPDSTNVNLVQEKRSAKLGDVYGTSATMIKNKNYVTLTLDHGVNPEKATYSYVLLPNANAEETEAYAKAAPIKIIKNNEFAQAVYHETENIMGVNFFTETETQVEEISSKNPASVLYQNKDGKVTLAVSDPLFSQSKIELTLKGSWQLAAQNSDCKINHKSNLSVITLNVEDTFGKTVVLELEKYEVPPVQTEDEETELVDKPKQPAKTEVLTTNKVLENIYQITQKTLANIRKEGSRLTINNQSVTWVIDGNNLSEILPNSLNLKVTISDAEQAILNQFEQGKAIKLDFEEALELPGTFNLKLVIPEAIKGKSEYYLYSIERNQLKFVQKLVLNKDDSLELSIKDRKPLIIADGPLKEKKSIEQPVEEKIEKKKSSLSLYWMGVAFVLIIVAGAIFIVRKKEN